MRPQELELKTQEAFSKIKDRNLRAQIAKESLGIKRAGLALRRDLAELARDDARRKLGISTSFRMADYMRKVQILLKVALLVLKHHFVIFKGSLLRLNEMVVHLRFKLTIQYLKHLKLKLVKLSGCGRAD